LQPQNIYENIDRRFGNWMNVCYKRQTFSKKPPLHKNGQLLQINKKSDSKKQEYPQNINIIAKCSLKKKPRDFLHIDAKI
jgi:hypothetical protein